jgi:NADPH:quinone reductase
MRALHVVELTGPDGIRPVDIPAPEGDGRLVVRVRAVGVRYPDLLRAQGRYQERSEPPYVPFEEFAGIVVEAPIDSGLTRGDRVAGTATSAGAELVAASVDDVYHLPATMTDEQGAGIVLNYQTAILGLEIRGRLGRGEVVLIHGAGGGTGIAAIQVAKAAGARVIGVVSSSAKEEVAREAGADEVLDESDWTDRCLELSGGDGVDVVWDPVGGERWLDTLRALRPGGRWIVIGFAGGAIPSVPLNRVLLRNVDVVGVSTSGYRAAVPRGAARLRSRLTSLLEGGHVRPVIGRTYTFEDAASALCDIADRRALGKVVLTM